MLNRFTLVLFAVALLAGCAGDHHDKQNATFSDPRRIAVPAPVAAPPVPKLVPPEIVEPPSISREEFRTSQTASQQSFSGLGVQLGKVADNVEASLARFDTNATANVKTQFDSLARAQANLKFDLQSKIVSSIKTSLNLSNKATVDAEARIKMRMDSKLDVLADTQAQAMVGFNNRLESFQQTISAGRDAITTTNQFGTEYRNALRDDNRLTLAVVVVMALLMGWMQERSRRRAEERHHELAAKFGGKPCDLESSSQYRQS